MKRWLLIGMVSLVGLAQAFSDADDLSYVLQDLQNRAERGDPEAQEQMGNYYRNNSEESKAREMYTKLEAQGDSRGTEAIQEMDEDAGVTKLVKGILSFIGCEPSDFNVFVFWFILGVAAVFFPPLWLVIILAILSVLMGC